MVKGRWLCTLALIGCGGKGGSNPSDGPPVDDTDIDAPPPITRSINVGGAAFTGVDFPGDWEADSQAASVCGPMFFDAGQGIKNTVDDALFVNQAFGKPTLTCAIANIPAGSYTVTLLYGPTFYGVGCSSTVAQRFSIELEGTEVDPDFQLSVASGGCVKDSGANPNAKPVTRSFDLDIMDGIFDLVETSTAPGNEAAMISAIQLVQH